ncbi:hypothetical protein P170DRAFT_471581 [Aspergillus steynii IBT 23096]|uniref:Uncharacterized protein n=1 Tax=Aspergillus steynii IBT 23096 TaxID=1392250 RepID=A0A2I2GFJ2_9EURO|nr:uncharacterized protein P170DRAFT_471581 [Aspergillus steynii IBT 23096]PLB51652.1 hypothetical protein P170DRAFT_471581 [Aspergillus steynii IBT 23096]
MHCPRCNHSYNEKPHTSWLMFEQACACDCHAYPSKYPYALPGAFPSDTPIRSALYPVSSKVKEFVKKKRADERRGAEQERLAEEKARAVWDSKEPMPEEKFIEMKKRKIAVPIIDEPPFYHSLVSIRRLTNTIPHITERRVSGFYIVRQDYVNELPYRRVPGWSIPWWCIDYRPTTPEEFCEKCNQISGF